RWTPVIDLKSIFQMPYDVMAEADVSYRGGMAFGQARTSHVWNTYLGLKKNFLAGRVSLSLYVKDIFNTNHFNSSILLAGRKAILYEKEFEDMRKFGISISWRINEGIGKSEKKDRKVCIDELNRVNL
ncbi:MAG: outer membrane beta-barrel family protein, partial [Muribaculaceae bacterium]|nr:outer membrane beta-barrel family protein [Muribaculaceae bacterium]